MKRLRVLALVPQGMKPPRDLEGVSERDVNVWKMEYDVLQTMDALGHQTECIDVSWDLAPIEEAVRTFDPHLVFNMLEDFHGIVTFDQNVVAYLELLRRPYTGCNPRGLVLSRDKTLTKKVLAWHRIPTPRFRVLRLGRRIPSGLRMRYPLIVKSVAEDASAGIAQASLVTSGETLADRVAFIHEQIRDDALVEEYIEGRELYVGVLGNERFQIFPVWELILSGLPEGSPRIATETVKFNVSYQEKYDIHSERARDLPPEVEGRATSLARRMARALSITGYARFDMRLDGAGNLYVLEANPNPDLSRDEDFALSAEAGGVPYERLIQRILGLGLAYHKSLGRPGGRIG